MRSPSLLLLASLLVGLVVVLRVFVDGSSDAEELSIASGRPALRAGPDADTLLAPPEVESAVARSEAPRSEEQPGDSSSSVEILVRVVDGDETPLAGIVVLDARTGDSWATTDARGEARRRHRPRGSFDVVELTVRTDGYAHERRSIQLGRFGSSGGVAETTFVLRPAGALAGRVVRRGGGEFTAVVEAYLDDPGLQPRIASRERGGEPVTSAWTEADGTYRLRGLAPGRWRVAASHDGRGWSWSEVVLVERAEATPVEDLVLLEAVPDPTLDGRVVDDAGLPVSGARVRYSFSRGGSGTRSTDAHGRFSVPGPPGESVDLQVVGGPGLGTVSGAGGIGGAPVELVLPARPVLVVRLEVPAGFRARDVDWRLLDAFEDVLLTHHARADEERVDWPEAAVWIDVAADDRLAGARVGLPPRPARGENSVLLALRRADH